VPTQRASSGAASASARERARRKQAKGPSAKLLLDTHTFLWFVTGNAQLSVVARRAIEERSNTIYVSAASAWEIAIKRRLGKLPAAVQFAPNLSGYLRQHGFMELPVTIDHAEVAGDLPPHHRDPFDRMLIGQARTERITLVSNEVLFDVYGISRLW
jgi:PIN domain nuclease of toxin-antitoxin system